MAQKCHGNFNFTHRQFQFVLGNFNLLTAISICSQQPFQFIYGNFNLLAATSILLTAISIYSQQFLLFHGNAHGIFSLAHHLSTTAADSSDQKSKCKIKSRYLKKIFKVKSENQTSKVDSRTLMPVDSEKTTEEFTAPRKL